MIQTAGEIVEVMQYLFNAEIARLRSMSSVLETVFTVQSFRPVPLAHLTMMESTLKDCSETAPASQFHWISLVEVVYVSDIHETFYQNVENIQCLPQILAHQRRMTWWIDWGLVDA